MSNNKTIDESQLVTIFKALANDNRLKIYNILIRCCQPGTSCSTDSLAANSPGTDSQCDGALKCCVGDLDSQLDIAASTLSHHLKELNRAGLINMTREGKQVFCSVNTQNLKQLQNLFNTDQPFKLAETKHQETNHE